MLTRSKITMIYHEHGLRYTCELFVNKELIGYFEIFIYQNIPSMNIHIEDEYQGYGLSRKMVRFLIDHLNWDENTLLYIDTDASNGFWDKFGMTENKNGNGYEKVVAIKDIFNGCIKN